MKQVFYSNGKLFITGEYVVLDGANAFALPTKLGQDLIVEEGNKSEINWKSFDSDGSIWFEDRLSFSAVMNRERFESAVKDTLIQILHEAHLLQPEFLESASGFNISTHLTFPRKWGLGTSSTLINNIADWFDIDPFLLLKNSFGGSGYDIACARSNSPVLYHLHDGNPVTQQIVFKPEFLSALYFVYLNQKQSSKSAIASYRNKTSDRKILIDQINAITDIIIHTSDAGVFENALKEHEKLMSGILELKPVQETLFPDFIGTVKSLGAWGGDFVLAVSEEDPTAYFKEKGFETIIPYRDLIL